MLDDVLTPAEIATVLSGLSGRAPTGVRNRALVALLYATGLRIGEALGLSDDALDLTQATVRVDAKRTVKIHGNAVQFLEAWRMTRDQRDLQSSPFFCTLKGGRVKDAYVRAMFGRAAKRAGLAKRLHAFGLRRSFAVRAYEEGFSLEELQQQLGHSNSQATFGYLADASSKLAEAAGRSLPFDLATAPSPMVAQRKPEPSPPPLPEPPPALPKAPKADDGAAYLGGDVRVVRPITLEEL